MFDWLTLTSKWSDFLHTQENCPFFGEYEWFGCLLDYFADLRQVEDLENNSSEDGDAQRKLLLDLSTSPEHELVIIPMIIEKVLLPRLTGSFSYHHSKSYLMQKDISQTIRFAHAFLFAHSILFLMSRPKVVWIPQRLHSLRSYLQIKCIPAQMKTQLFWFLVLNRNRFGFVGSPLLGANASAGGSCACFRKSIADCLCREQGYSASFWSRPPTHGADYSSWCLYPSLFQTVSTMFLLPLAKKLAFSISHWGKGDW